MHAHRHAPWVRDCSGLIKAQLHGRGGSSVQMASPGWWENCSGGLDPSSVGRGLTPDGDMPLQAVTEAFRAVTAEEEEKEGDSTCETLEIRLC